MAGRSPAGRRSPNVGLWLAQAGRPGPADRAKRRDSPIWEPAPHGTWSGGGRLRTDPTYCEMERPNAYTGSTAEPAILALTETIR
jgi:hypothetical protein